MPLELIIITPDRKQQLPGLRQVVLQTPLGETGLLPDHAAVISLVDCGIVRAFAVGADGREPPRCFVVGAGSLRAVDDRLTLLTPRLAAEDELDATAARDELDEAEAELATLDPLMDAEDYAEWLEVAEFRRAVLELDDELARH